jgi:hypothetical protein
MTTTVDESEYHAGISNSSNELILLRDEIHWLHQQLENAAWNGTTTTSGSHTTQNNNVQHISHLGARKERQQLVSQVKRLERDYNLLYSKVVVDNSTWKDGTIKEFTHFFSHIPKSGGTYALRAITSLVMEDPQWKRLDDGDRFRPCDVGTTSLDHFQARFPVHWKGIPCTLWQSEQPYRPSVAKHVYTIVRSPKEHVISQYFHCTESPAHKTRAPLMPQTLDAWVESWASAIGNPAAIQSNSRYQCYNPINHQSWFLGFDYRSTKQQLRNKFDVIGITAEMSKSVCLVAIQYAGFVPEKCDCTDTSKQLHIKKATHGVTHHGGSYSMSSSQEQAISKLTDLDQLLYNLATEIFHEQVQRVEQQHQVTLCDNL